MKKIYLILLSFCFALLLNAQVSKISTITAGGLSSVLTVEELASITKLTLTGIIDARDFKTMRDKMPLLAELDLSNVTVAAYIGPEGTSIWTNNNYKADAVPESAFMDSYLKGKTSLTSVVLPGSITIIENFAFQKCGNLMSVSIPTSVISIERYAFQGCTSLTSVTIPSSVTFIGEHAFQDCSSLNSTYVNGYVPINLSSSEGVFLNVDKTTCTLNVPYGKGTLYRAAKEWQDFTNIVETPGFLLSPGTISLAAAQGSTANVNVTANVSWTASSDQTWLSVSPTSGTDNNTLIFTAEANPSIGTRTAKVTILATGVEAQTIFIRQQATYAPLNVTAGGLSSVLTVEELASITKLTLTGTIDARDFKTMRDKMPLLAELDLSGVTIAAYMGPEGTSIWENNNYEANAVPESAFLDSKWSGKASLTSVVLPGSITIIENFAFYTCKNLIFVSVPSSVISIEQYAFNGCIGLTGTLTIPSSVTSIVEYAFQGCSGLTSVTIPSSVTFIGEYAFHGCSGLNSIYANGSIPINLSSSKEVFLNVDKITCTLNVPYGTGTLYRAAKQWQNFTDIVEKMNGFLLSSGTISLAAAQGSTANVNVTANVSWTTSSDQTWLSVSPTSGTDNNTLIFTAEANPSIETRIAKVTVLATGVEAQTIFITQDALNMAPFAKAGINQTVNEGGMVTLDGTDSSDPNNDVLTYLWTAPLGITLSSTTAAKPTFTAPEVIANADYTFSLTVNDGLVSSTDAQVIVTVNQINKAPLAIAVVDQSLIENTLVCVDGSGSNDPDNNTLTYLWTMPLGITLNSTTAANPTFVAPDVKNDTILIFTLVVNDGFENSIPFEVKISIKNSITKSEVQLVNKLKVFPNPSKGIINIIGLQANMKNKIAIYTISGSLIKKKVSNKQIENIDISDQVSGAYLLIINEKTFNILKK